MQLRRAHLPIDVTMYRPSPALLNLNTPPSSPNGHSSSRLHLPASLLLLLAAIHWLVLQLPFAAALKSAVRSNTLLPLLPPPPLLLLGLTEGFGARQVLAGPASALIAGGRLLLLALLSVAAAGASLINT
eukprot:GHRQ01022699.1.p2 GENE.GHRQ01022699.1~~GHRQ01022699.1.p2  ORF type:complete len:130 (-),score=21.13 GHRQ01022699.1:408-797(-)